MNDREKTAIETHIEYILDAFERACERDPADALEITIMTMEALGGMQNAIHTMLSHVKIIKEEI